MKRRTEQRRFLGWMCVSPGGHPIGGVCCGSEGRNNAHNVAVIYGGSVVRVMWVMQAPRERRKRCAR